MPSQPHHSRWTTASVCGALLLIFAGLSWFSVSTKSATNDEPLHLAGGYSHVFLHDYRVNPEDPPLWNYLFMLPTSAQPKFHLPTSDPMWQKFLDDSAWNFAWSSLILFTAENDGPRRIQSSRAMMLPLGLALGAVIAVWSYQRGGKLAAILATTLFALDPNFIAHACLIKNDVPITLLIVAMAFALDRCARRATLWNIACIALLLGAGLNTKFSGVLMLPILAVALAFRAFSSTSWIVLNRTLHTRAARFAAVSGIFVACLIVGWVITWMSYGFRFAATPDHSELNLQRVIELTERNREIAGLSGEGIVTAAVWWANEHKLLPHAWLYGFLYAYQSSLVRHAYLLGETSTTGWWYYFPLAMAFKTPLATIAGLLLAIALCLKREARASTAGWTRSSLLIPVIVYGFSAVSNNLNIGIRHVFALYPFMFIFIAVIVANFSRAKWIVPAIVIGLAAESLAAFPNYLAFFNAGCGGSRGGFRLLSDSNLDWGQDLPLLAQWQREHSPARLYFCFSGSADPAAYGVDYINMPRGYFLNPQAELPDANSRGVVAISASRLQGLYLDGELRDYYTNIARTQTPRAVLGGSIYLYDLPLVRRDSPAR